MAIATSTWVALALAAASAGLQYSNTRSVQKQQDGQAAAAIRSQGAKQKDADARVDEEVKKMQASTADDERRQRLADYMTTIQRSKAGMTEGLAPQVGSDAFKADAAGAAEGVQKYAGDQAALMARVDAPQMQRQGEGFGFGNLATDVGLIQRGSRGQAFIDELRMRAIRRNPYTDLAAGVLGGASSAAMGMGGGYGSTTNAGMVGDSTMKAYPGGKTY